MTRLASLGLLGNFVGMLTDSRSFLSYTRHDYVRRILCNIIGQWVEDGAVSYTHLDVYKRQGKTAGTGRQGGTALLGPGGK